MLAAGWSKISNKFHCSSPKEKGQAYSLNGLKVGVCPGVRLEEWLRWFAHPFVVLRAGHLRSTLFLLLDLQKWQFWWGFFFFCLFVSFGAEFAPGAQAHSYF